MRRLLIILAVGAALAGCDQSESYTAITLSDPRLAEFNDLLTIDRAALGMVALPGSANVSVERASGRDYDVMLHVYANHQQRTIAFRRDGGKLKWIHEQVTVDGPRQYTTVDGTFNERIVLAYETSRVAGERLNQLNVSYEGPDANLKANPKLVDVKPLLDQWLQRP